MRKLLFVVLFFLVIPVIVFAKKNTSIYQELTNVMVNSKPSGMADYKGIKIPYYEIKKGGFGYVSSKQEFRGQFKGYHFAVTSKEVTIYWLGLDNKSTQKKIEKIKKELLKSAARRK